jgi:hypothetical protein
LDAAAEAGFLISSSINELLYFFSVHTHPLQIFDDAEKMPYVPKATAFNSEAIYQVSCFDYPILFLL